MTDDTRIKPADPEKEIAEPFGDERLFHEINLLRLEGYYFCLDPKEAAKRRGKRAFEETLKMGADAIEKRPVVISINPDYGQPSVVAYKILQAIIKKLSDYGLPASQTVYFSQRELARMVGRKSFGGRCQKHFLHAFMQLRDTKILCWFYEKETDTWTAADFQILDGALFSGKANRITQCYVRINDFIVSSLNSRYTTCLNYARMQALEPIGTALYKHLFYHFSNIYSAKKRKDFFYNKDYADICTAWLGGLKVLRFRSKIVKEQLGRHLDDLKRIKLIKNYTLEQNAKGEAKKTQFMIRTFGGVRGFLKPWLAEREVRAAKRARAAAEEAEAREQFLRERYEAFKTRSIAQFKASLASEELHELESQLRQRVISNHGSTYMVDMMVQVQLDTTIAERFNLLSYDDWKAQAKA
jgi:hypothetical protein